MHVSHTRMSVSIEKSESSERHGLSSDHLLERGQVGILNILATPLIYLMIFNDTFS